MRISPTRSLSATADDIMSEVRSFVNSPAFDIVFEEIRSGYVVELEEAPVEGLTSTALHAKVKALQDVRANIVLFATRGPRNKVDTK